MLVKLNFEILRIKIQHMDYYFIDTSLAVKPLPFC